ncbi:MAG: 5-formyltetrahydrofolate cyclo-ligase, partial [Rickettsiales bacterium]|nr:5-formyltetrahydrofolate cyclo-ligase [Rickettsiales bacterium]
LKDKYIIVNVTSLNELTPGKFGIMEPKSSKEKKKIYTNQIWLVPGLGFDKAGNRIGFGKGIYDQLLSKSNNYKIGIGYDIQLIKKVPIEKHDIKMNTIITNNGIITI